MKQYTICWSCKNCCGKCSWSSTFTEVEGWEATPTKVNIMSGVVVNSYIVHKCPKYEFKSVYISATKLAKLIGLFSISNYEKAIEIFKRKFKGYNIRLQKGIKRSYFIVEKEVEVMKC